MTKSEKNSIIKWAKTLTDDELEKEYYRAIYDRNRSFLEFEGSSMAQLVSIVVRILSISLLLNRLS